MSDFSQRLRDKIRDVPDFPKPGILFKDITPVLADTQLTLDITENLSNYWKGKKVDGVVGVESRGFIFGLQLAQNLEVPFIPVRKSGKLPFETISHSYDLEYGSAEMEIHIDAVEKGHHILVHDDLLATGGTAMAAAELIRKSGGVVSGFSFLIELSFLKGRERLMNSTDVHALITY